MEPSLTSRQSVKKESIQLTSAAALCVRQPAIAREQDENIRSVLETNLKKLREKGKQ
jgi:hypothetical protein